MKCCRCEYQWEKRLEERPKTCPRCKSYRYDVPKSEMPRHCGRCGYGWVQRGKATPKTCPRCRSWKWKE